MICKVRDVAIHYKVVGQGRPIVSLHGFTLDHRSMIGCFEPIFTHREGWQRIYLDLPGHGKTAGREWIQSSDDVLDLLFGFIDTVIPDKRYLVAGLSYGGYLAQGLVNKKSDMVDGVLLIVPRIVGNPQARALPPKMVIAREEAFLASLSPGDREDFEEVAVIQTQNHWQRYSQVITPAVKIADTAFLERFDPRKDDFSFAINSPSFRFDKPTLILVGRQDHWIGYRDAWNILEHYPRATFAVLDSAGHALQLEQSLLFNALVSEWLDRVEEMQIS
ncbi:MAG: alpha/beta fold hydrolase [Candidatus Odinarchaeota archaeon]